MEINLKSAIRKQNNSQRKILYPDKPLSEKEQNLAICNITFAIT